MRSTAMVNNTKHPPIMEPAMAISLPFNSCGLSLILFMLMSPRMSPAKPKGAPPKQMATREQISEAIAKPSFFLYKGG